MNQLFYPGLRVQTLAGEIDTDHKGSERHTPAAAWGHISAHNHADHWDVCFPNGAWVVITESELSDTVAYRTAPPQTLEQCALALQYGQATTQLTYLDGHLSDVTQTVAGNPALILDHVRAFNRLQADAVEILSVLRTLWNRWDNLDQEDNPGLGDALARLSGTTHPWELGTTESQSASEVAAPPHSLARATNGDAIQDPPEGGLLAHGWSLADDYTKELFPGAVFERRMGGSGTPFVVHDLTIVDTRAGEWIPIHGSIKMQAVSTPALAASALLRHWQELPDVHKLRAK